MPKFSKIRATVSCASASKCFVAAAGFTPPVVTSGNWYTTAACTNNVVSTEGASSLVAGTAALASVLISMYWFEIGVLKMV